jgi:hypothetical protein
MNPNKYLFLLLSLFFALCKYKCTGQKSYPKQDCHVNIDWPKKRYDPIEKQKRIILKLDTYKKLNYNAVIVQIRSVGDAFILLAPWSKYLTGKEGKHLLRLEWMITEAHNRGFVPRLVEPIPSYYGFKNRYSKSYP